jgi:hypothetical protein
VPAQPTCPKLINVDLSGLKGKVFPLHLADVTLPRARQRRHPRQEQPRGWCPWLPVAGAAVEAPAADAAAPAADAKGKAKKK